MASATVVSFLLQMDALNHVRQRQLRDVVSFFMQDSKNDPKPEKPANAAAGSAKPKPEGDNKTTTRWGALQLSVNHHQSIKHSTIDQISNQSIVLAWHELCEATV